MITWHRLLLATCFSCLIPMSAFSEAPVVDESENYAMLDDEQPVAIEQPASRAPIQDEYDDEPALAQESSLPRHTAENQASLLNKVQGLQQEVQELRGQLEVQTHELKLLKEQQLSFYKDLDARIASGRTSTTTTVPPNHAKPTISLETPSKPVAAPNPITIPVKSTPQAVNTNKHTNPAEEQIRYLAAYELVKNKQYVQAINAMQGFVTEFPQSGYTVNAQYWLGELYLVKKDYPKSIQHFESVLQQYPSSGKAAASLLKIGYALAESGQVGAAKARLSQVIKNYPDTNTAHLAAAKLETLDS